MSEYNVSKQRLVEEKADFCEQLKAELAKLPSPSEDQIMALVHAAVAANPVSMPSYIQLSEQLQREEPLFQSVNWSEPLLLLHVFARGEPIETFTLFVEHAFTKGRSGECGVERLIEHLPYFAEKLDWSGDVLADIVTCKPMPAAGVTVELLERLPRSACEFLANKMLMRCSVLDKHRYSGNPVLGRETFNCVAKKIDLDKEALCAAFKKAAHLSIDDAKTLFPYWFDSFEWKQSSWQVDIQWAISNLTLSSDYSESLQYVWNALLANVAVKMRTYAQEALPEVTSVLEPLKKFYQHSGSAVNMLFELHTRLDAKTVNWCLDRSTLTYAPDIVAWCQHPAYSPDERLAWMVKYIKNIPACKNLKERLLLLPSPIRDIAAAYYYCGFMSNPNGRMSKLKNAPRLTTDALRVDFIKDYMPEFGGLVNAAASMTTDYKTLWRLCLARVKTPRGSKKKQEMAKQIVVPDDLA